MLRGLVAIGLVLVLVWHAQAGEAPPPQNPQFLPLVVDPKPTNTPTATATATATPTQTATPTTPPPEPITLTGTGSMVTSVIALPAPITRVRSSHQGQSNFIVWAYEDGTTNKQLVANAIGNHQGARPLESDRPTYFEVTADGAWSLIIEPLPDEPGAVGALSGNDEYVSGFFTPPQSGVGTYSFSHDGQSNFIVWARCNDLFGSDLAVNEIGPFQGSAVVEFRGDRCYWDIMADGNWSITAQ